MTKYDKAKRQLTFAKEYLDLALQYYPVDGMSSIKGHVFRFLFQLLELPENADIRDALGAKKMGLEETAVWVRELDEVRYGTESAAEKYTNGKILSPGTWYRRHRSSGMVLKQEEEKKEKLMGLKERLEALRQKRAETTVVVSGLGGLYTDPKTRSVQQL